MKCIALTGIFPQVIDELKKGIPRTVELTSAHNIISLTQVEPGSQIFLTMVDCEDVAVGDTGIIVEVISVAITMKHTVESGRGYHLMEREKLSARVKVSSFQTRQLEQCYQMFDHRAQNSRCCPSGYFSCRMK